MKKRIMHNKEPHRLIPNEVDKLLYNTYAQAQEATHTTEWASLQQRLVAYDAHKLKVKYSLAALVLCLCLGVSYMVYQYNKNNTLLNSQTTPQASTNHTHITKTQALQATSTQANNELANQTTTNTIPAVTATTQAASKYTTKPSTLTQATVTTNHNTAYTQANDANAYANNIKHKKQVKQYPNTNQVYTTKNSNAISKNNTTANLPSVYHAGVDEVLIVQSGAIQNLNSAIAYTYNIAKTPATVQPAQAHTSNITTTYPLSTLPVVTKAKQKRARPVPEHEYYAGTKMLYAEVYSGINNSTKQRNNFAAFLAPSGYTTKRLTQEHTLSTMQAGVYLKLRNKHWILGTGLGYLQLGDRVQYDAAYSGTIALNSTKATQYTYLEIPLIAGYEWAHKHWGVSIQGGVSANVLMQLRGQYVSVNNFTTALYDVKANKQDFKKSIIQLILTPQLNYYMNSNTNLYIAPNLRHSLTPITTQSSGLQQSYNSMGLTFGIRTLIKQK